MAAAVWTIACWFTSSYVIAAHQLLYPFS